jgi:hypothetical protein
MMAGSKMVVARLCVVTSDCLQLNHALNENRKIQFARDKRRPGTILSDMAVLTLCPAF